MTVQAIGIGLVALALGLAVGVVVAARRRPGGGGDLARVEARLEVQAAELRRLADSGAGRDRTGEELSEGLRDARVVLRELRLREDERRARDDEHREVVRRLATVLAGGASKGRSGEHLLREHLAQLPPGMLATDVRINGKVVEFGLLLPDGRRMPIDSKWTALAELEALEAAQDPMARDQCARAVERSVVDRAREVAQYLDPAVTSPVAVAAVPDAAYGVLRQAHADAFAKGVVIVPYSAALPIVLFLYSLVQRFGDASDVTVALAEVGRALDGMELVMENKVARAATMLANGGDEFRSALGQARGSISRARGPSTSPEADGDGERLSVVH